MSGEEVHLSEGTPVYRTDVAALSELFDIQQETIRLLVEETRIHTDLIFGLDDRLYAIGWVLFGTVAALVGILLWLVLG